jgi:hypothetical protein
VATVGVAKRGFERDRDGGGTDVYDFHDRFLFYSALVELFGLWWLGRGFGVASGG